MTFVKTHQPCPMCGSSDAAGFNEDGSVYCFSCGEYDRANKGTTMEQQAPPQTQGYAEEGQFAALADRGISLDTAKKYGVKVAYTSTATSLNTCTLTSEKKIRSLLKLD